MFFLKLQILHGIFLKFVTHSKHWLCIHVTLLTSLLESVQFLALFLCPCLFRPSENMWCSRCADTPRCPHFSTVISPSWITEQILVGKCSHRGALARRERQISCKIVTWTKQTWRKRHNTKHFLSEVSKAIWKGAWILICNITHLRTHETVPLSCELLARPLLAFSWSMPPSSR